MRIHTRKFRSIDVLVITALLCAAFVIRTPAKPNPEPDQWVLPVCLGLVVIIVGGCVTYKIGNFCDRHFPRTNNIPPNTNTARIVMQNSSDLVTWTTVLDTNCCLDAFEYRPDTNLHHMFYRAVFP